MLIGNLTRDPELKTTNNGKSVCTFTLAVNRMKRDANGNSQADFIPIVTWNQQAENCARYLDKGKKVAACGSVQTRSYNTQDGSKRYVTEIMAQEVSFLSPANERTAQDYTAAPSDPANYSYGQYGAMEVDDDELPF
ncbi:single-stranded DNA-binding protein [Eubacteriales bacterium OttesenSCG-928-N13]|nr:single-stranded DNA-binding protein [Eubacteriales bacterium OttesenSCG-928-N13]